MTSHTSSPVAIHLLAGGPGSRRKGRDLLAQVLESSGMRSPSIAYVGAASGDNRDFFRMISELFREAGAGGVTLVPLAGSNPDTATARRLLEETDIVFISGGDVEAGMDVLQSCKLLPALRRLHARGKPFFGLSAGSIMLARQWIRWADHSDNSSAKLFPCMGFAPLLCDTHGEEDGWEELLALLQLSPEGTVGYGIPTGGGLCVTPSGSVTAMGVPLHRFAHRNGKVVRLPD